MSRAALDRAIDPGEAWLARALGHARAISAAVLGSAMAGTTGHAAVLGGKASWALARSGVRAALAWGLAAVSIGGVVAPKAGRRANSFMNDGVGVIEHEALPRLRAPMFYIVGEEESVENLEVLVKVGPKIV